LQQGTAGIVHGVILQPDGKILAIGQLPGRRPGPRFAVVRYNTTLPRHLLRRQRRLIDSFNNSYQVWANTVSSS